MLPSKTSNSTREKIRSSRSTKIVIKEMVRKEFLLLLRSPPYSKKEMIRRQEKKKPARIARNVRIRRITLQ